MTIIKTSAPYEFLVRWKDGAIAGAHVRYLETIKDGDTVVSVKEGDPMPVSLAGGAGFPLADILTPLQTQALADLATAQAVVAPLQAEIARLTALVPAPVTATTVISKRQGRAQLKAEGLLAPVETYMASLPADDTTRMAYEDATEWVRTDPNVLAMMTMLGKSSADADAFFAAAVSL